MKKYGSVGLLVLGGLLMVLSNGKFLLASAAWVFPMLFLFAIKEWNWKVAVVALGVVTAVSNQLSFQGMLPSLPIPLFEYIPAMAGFLYAIPFILQKIAYQKSYRFIATLFLPSTYALVDYANQYFNPYGTFGLLGYSQHGNLPILQVASVVGVTGISFIIMWTASIVYWLSLAGKRQSKRIVIGVLLTAMLAIAIGGGLRGSVASDTTTVLTSGIHTVDRNDAEVLEIYNLHEKDLNDFLQKSEKRMDVLIELTEEEARAGAKIIHHSEGAIVMDVSQKTLYLERLGEVAKEWGVYILTVPYIFTGEDAQNENVLYIIDPSGEVALEHYKYGGNMVENTVLGDRTIHFVDTVYGRISGIICWDKDFPAVVDQVGEKDIDILFIPSADWREISPYHTIVGTLRGVENGASVVTQTVNGLSLITDDRGRVLAKMDHFTTDHWVMRGYVPTEGSATLYSQWGKYLWACTIIIVLITFLSLYFSKRGNGEE